MFEHICRRGASTMASTFCSNSATGKTSSFRGKRSRGSTTKRVRFLPSVSVRPLFIDANEREVMWYTPEELQIQRQNDLKVASMYIDMSNEKEEQESTSASCQFWTVRGIEHFLDNERLGRKRLNKLRGAAIVKMEQSRQRMESSEVLDSERLAEQYYKISKRCQDDAYKQGAADKLEVKLDPNELMEIATKCIVSMLQAHPSFLRSLSRET